MDGVALTASPASRERLGPLDNPATPVPLALPEPPVTPEPQADKAPLARTDPQGTLAWLDLPVCPVFKDPLDLPDLPAVLETAE